MRIFTGEIEGDKRLVIKLESATEGIGAMKSGQAGLVDDEVLKEIGIDLYLDQETGILSIGRRQEPSTATTAEPSG